MRLSLRFVMAASIAAAWVCSARADEVQFKNGDKLTGKIVSAEGGKLKINTAMAGTVDVSLSNVKTFSTDAPITLRLNDGALLQQPVTTSAAGQIAVKPASAPVQNVAISNIKSINLKTTWSGNVTAGALITRGNSDTEAFNFGFDVNRRTDQDRIDVNGQYLFGRQRDDDTGVKSTSTDNWRIAGKYDYFFSKKLYGFASLGIERDNIADLNLRLTPAVGAGYQWVERSDFNFSTEAGLAWVHEDYNNDGTNENVSLKLAYHLDKQLRPGLKLIHNLTYFPSIETLHDYLITTDAGIRADLTDKMFAEFKVELKYDSTPAPDASRSDLRYIVGVGWTF